MAMTLVRDIQEAATGDGTPVAVLLRKVKLLASRLGAPEVGLWAQQELDGYDSPNDLPPYRGPFPATVVGDTAGPMGSGVKNLPFPPLAVADQFRSSHLFKLSFTQGVAELESLVEAGQELAELWSPNTVAMIPVMMNGGIIKWDRPMNWVTVRKPVSRSMLVGVLDAIRNRLLDFAIRLEDEEPAVQTDERSKDPQNVRQIFKTTVYAGAANVAVGNRDVDQSLSPPAEGDAEGLLTYLRAMGVPHGAVVDLEAALKAEAQDPRLDSQSQPGRRVLGWLSKLSTGTADRVLSPVTVNLVTQALLRHFGIGT